MIDYEKYDGNVGRFLTAHDALSRTAQFRDYKKEQQCEPDSFTRAEFFGINQINRLLGRKDCVGIRIYYGKTYEDTDGHIIDGKLGDRNLTSRLVIVGVRADGTDIFDDPTGQKGVGDGDALGDGHVCPQHCGNPPGALSRS